MQTVTGRVVADVSFANMFGSFTSRDPVITIEAVRDPANGFSLP
jgi:hypothetical protein